MNFMSSTAKFPMSISEGLGFAGVGSLIYSGLHTIISKRDAMLIAGAVFLLLSSILIIFRVWNSRDSQFVLADSSKGKAADNPVRDAKHLIQTTHFTGIEPYEPYIALLKNKLSEGVKVRRLVARDPTVPAAKYDWLDTFSGSTNYSQLDVVDPFPLPLDIMIFDRKVVVLHLPANLDGDDFHSAITLENEEVAHLFENVIKRMEIRASMQRKAPPKSVDHGDA